MREARWAVLAAGLLGQTAAATAGVLPGPVLLLVAPSLVGACLLATCTGERAMVLLRRSATALVLAATAWSVPLLVSAGPDLAVLGPLLVVVQVAQALTWGLRRGLQTGLLVAAGLLVLGASFAPDVLVGLPLLAGWAAGVAALVLLGPSPTEDVDAVATGEGVRRPPVAAATSLGIALGLLVFLVLPVPDGGGAAGGFAPTGLPGPGPSTRAGALTGDSLDLRTRGELSDRVLAEVPDDGTPLWRSRAYSTWDGTSWSSPEREERLVPGPPFLVPGERTGPVTRAQVDLRTRSGPVWAPGLPVAVQAASGPAASDGDGSLRLPWDAEGYVVESAALETDPAVLRRAAPGPADPRWLQLPAALPERVRTLARSITADAPTTYDKVRAVESWLGDNATYRLDSPVPGPGEDAVDRFLFVDRTGFCEQFAAAETVLLRALGIPARLVTGLAYGEQVGAGRRVFREKMLHAWVEVSYAGVGWSASDPTAEAGLASVTPSLRSKAAAALTSALAVPEGWPGGRPALALLLLGLLAIGVVVHRRLCDRLRDRRAARARLSTSASSGSASRERPALTAFLRWDAALGVNSRGSSETLADLRWRLDPPPSVLSALDVVERECFGPQPPGDDETRTAVDALVSARSGSAVSARSGSAVSARSGSAVSARSGSAVSARSGDDGAGRSGDGPTPRPS